MSYESKGFIRINLDECTKCGRCIEVCPTDVFRVDENTSFPIIKYPVDCHKCYICEEECPEQCILIDSDSPNMHRKSIYDIKGISLDVEIK